MSESTNNPLNDFLNQAEEESEDSLFAPIPFPSQPEPAGAAVPARSSAAGARCENAGNPGYSAGAGADTGSNAFSHASPAEACTR